MSTLTIPLDLPVTVHLSDREFSLMKAREILAVPTAVTGHWEGPESPAKMPEPPVIRLDIGWFPQIAGHGYEDVGHAAALLAAHLAGLDPDWPTPHVFVRGLPVVDARFSWVASPWPIPPDCGERLDGVREEIAASLEGRHPDLAAALRGPGEDARRCNCEGCGCCGE